MKKSAAEEQHILSLNRVGVQKDFKSIMKQTAHLVGLQLPKEHQHQDNIKDPFDNRKPENK